MKKILVPFDFSNSAVQAFKFACEIASKSKGEVFVLNVIELPSLHSSSLVPVQAYENAFIKEAKFKAHKNFEKIKDKWGGKVKVHLSIELDSVIHGITKYVNKKRIDLVVMGTHGAGGFKEVMIGSNTEKIVRASKVPVIAVKQAAKITSIKNIIFPVGIDLPSKKLTDQVKLLQVFLKGHLHILYVNTPTNFTSDVITESRVIEFARQNQFKNCSIHIFNDIDEETGIINFSLKIKYSMVAMATHGRKGINRLLSGSIAEDVVNHISCPIWTFSER